MRACCQACASLCVGLGQKKPGKQEQVSHGDRVAFNAADGDLLEGSGRSCSLSRLADMACCLVAAAILFSFFSNIHTRLDSPEIRSV